MIRQPPTLGVALTLEQWETTPGLAGFVLERQRDIELRDLVEIGALQNGAWQDSVARARRLLAGHTGRLGIHGPFWGIAIDTPDPDVRAVVQARIDAALDAVIALCGSRGGHMVLHSPYTTWHWYNRGTFHDDCAGVLERTHATIGGAVKKACDHGITLVLENCEDKDPFERVALAASFNSPAVRVSLDTGHAHYCHGALGAPPVDVCLRAAGAALAHLHLQDADGFGDRHWAIGRGTIRWHSVFAALAEMETLPLLLLEMADVRDALVSAKWLAEQGLAV